MEGKVWIVTENYQSGTTCHWGTAAKYPKPTQGDLLTLLSNGPGKPFPGAIPFMGCFNRMRGPFCCYASFVRTGFKLMKCYYKFIKKYIYSFNICVPLTQKPKWFLKMKQGCRQLIKRYL